MNKTVIKNIIIAICVPSVVALGYFGYQYYNRKQKTKKLLDELQKFLDKKDSKLSGLNEQVVSQWKKSLDELKLDDFNPFFNYFMITIPYGKVTMIDDKNVTKTSWIYETTNKVEFDKASEKGIKAISGKEIEKLFNAIIPEK